MGLPNSTLSSSTKSQKMSSMAVTSTDGLYPTAMRRRVWCLGEIRLPYSDGAVTEH